MRHNTGGRSNIPNNVQTPTKPAQPANLSPSSGSASGDSADKEEKKSGFELHLSNGIDFSGPVWASASSSSKPKKDVGGVDSGYNFEAELVFPAWKLPKGKLEVSVTGGYTAPINKDKRGLWAIEGELKLGYADALNIGPAELTPYLSGSVETDKIRDETTNRKTTLSGKLGLEVEFKLPKIGNVQPSLIFDGNAGVERKLYGPHDDPKVEVPVEAKGQLQLSF